MRFVLLTLVAAVVACGDDPALDDPVAAAVFPDPRLDVELDLNPYGEAEGLWRYDWAADIGERPFRGRGSYEIDVTTGEAQIALRLDQGSSAPGFVIEVTLGQVLDFYPLGTRYMHVDWVEWQVPRDWREPRDETFVPLASAVTTSTGERSRGHDEASISPGYTDVLELDFDAATGSFRASIFIRFSEFTDRSWLMMVADIEGYLRVYCRVGERRAAQLRPNWVDPYEPEACTEVFDLIRDTPDDPDAPAPPYVLYPE